MLKFKNYVKAKSLAQAYELNQKQRNRIIGGMMWLKMSNASIDTAIDLSGLALDTIEETEDEFKIGCMVTLRQLELHEGLQKFSGNAFKKAVRSIVGVQFRNLATVGGSIFGRYGFSDVLTVFMAAETYVELYNGGIVSLEEFSESKRDNDILVRLIVKKTNLKCSYQSYRNSKTDFPVLTCAVAKDENGLRAVIGARPGKAVKIDIKQTSENLAKIVKTSSNMRASSEYRSHLVKILSQRALKEVLNDQKEVF